MKTSDVDQIHTVFRAIARERKAFLSGTRPSTNAWFKTIDGPAGSGSFQTGDDGWEALWALTDAALKAGNITARADRSESMRILSKVLMRKFGAEGFPVDQKNAARVLSETVKSSKRAFVSRTHFIPCQLTTFSEAQGITIGPVRFMTRKEVKAALRAAFKADQTIMARDANGDRDQINRAIAYYKGYQWFAQVTVQDCAPSRSVEIALATASSALDFLHALIGWRASREMSMAGQFGHFDRTASVMRNEPAGTLSITTGWQFRGGSLEEGWTQQLAENMDVGLDQAGLILESSVNPDLQRPMAQRMRDVALWFGEAVRDASPATRVIKFVTALERLTLTEKVDDIAESVSERVAALTVGQVDNLSFYPNKSLFKKIYAIRSDLAHGTLSPNDPKILAVVGKAGDYAEASILRALYVWSPENYSNSQFSPEKLRAWFDEIIAICKTDETIGIMQSDPQEPPSSA